MENEQGFSNSKTNTENNLKKIKMKKSFMKNNFYLKIKNKKKENKKIFKKLIVY